jgi:hypothetical protein
MTAPENTANIGFLLFDEVTGRTDLSIPMLASFIKKILESVQVRIIVI